MSMPNIPNVNPVINIDEKKSIDLLLASIAFEELGLAHIINAEAEEIQFVVGTLEKGHRKDDHREPPTIDELLEINKSVEHVMRKVIEKEMLLEFKLEDIVELSKTTSSTTTSTTSTTTTTTKKHEDEDDD